MAAPARPMAPPTALVLGAAAAAALMPMFLWLDADGTVRGAGPTLVKLCAPDPLVGRNFLDVFDLRRPRGAASVADLLRQRGGRLNLSLRTGPKTDLRGVAVPLGANGCVLVNLSFGILVADAVRDHRLTVADFAPTDLTVEMLYLVEANMGVREELRHMADRLEGAKAEAEEQAMTDTLTGLRNRRAMDQALATAIEQRIPFGLMHLDLDFFKEVNDTLGHAAGDHVLGHVARALRAETRASDTVARVGGDEFVLIFPGLGDPDRLATIAARILARLEQPTPFGDAVARVSASIGTTMSNLYARPEPARMLSDTDRALYMSKREGRSRVTAYSHDFDAGDAREEPSARASPR